MVEPDSERLELLEPFPAWDGDDFIDLPVLLKAAGKCTTDHISAGRPVAPYRGHLENISGNLFIGVINAFAGDRRRGQVTCATAQTAPFPELAKRLPARPGSAGCAIGDENYGEGSSREHAAMEPRFLNGRAVIVARRSPASTRRT